MKRRNVLGLIVGTGLAGGAGIAAADSLLGESPSGEIETTFELVKPELEVEDPPDLEVDDDTVHVRGTVGYGSSSCGTVELETVEYDEEEQRLNIVVSEAKHSTESCTEDLAWEGYESTIVVDGDIREVTATEHHYPPARQWDEETSTTIDLRD